MGAEDEKGKPCSHRASEGGGQASRGGQRAEIRREGGQTGQAHRGVTTAGAVAATSWSKPAGRTTIPSNLLEPLAPCHTTTSIPSEPRKSLVLIPARISLDTRSRLVSYGTCRRSSTRGLLVSWHWSCLACQACEGLARGWQSREPRSSFRCLLLWDDVAHAGSCGRTYPLAGPGLCSVLTRLSTDLTS